MTPEPSGRIERWSSGKCWPCVGQTCGPISRCWKPGSISGAEGFAVRRDPRLQRTPDELAADDDRASLQHRRARGILRAPPARDLPGAHPGARHPGTPGAARDAGRLRPGARCRRRASTRSWSSTARRRSARACLHSARELCLAAVHDRPFDVAAEVERLRDLAHRVQLGPSTAAIVAAAKARGIPFRRLNSGSLVQFGQGARQRRILTAETDRTSAIAESIAQDKDLTRSLLRAVGVPVPEGRPVVDAEDAWAAAREIGVPVVVKPRYGNQGRGVATDLTTREQVMAAFANAREEGDSVVVERFAPGVDYRVLVVGRRVVAAVTPRPGTGRRRRPADDRRAGRGGQPRPPPRRRSRDRAEQDRPRPDRAGRPGGAGLPARLGPPGRHAGPDPAQRQPEHRRDRHRRDRRGPSRCRRPRHRCRAGHRARHRRGRRRRPRHQPTAGGARGRGRRGERRPRAPDAPAAVRRFAPAGRRGDHRR